MKYYYLISGLPDLSWDASLKHIDFEGVFDTIKRNLEPGDLQLFHYLLYPNDNRNLLSHLFHEFKELPKGRFLYPFTLAPKVIESYKRDQSTFPDYMVDFLQESEAQFPSLSMREIESRLQVKFAGQIEKLSVPFIPAYFQFKWSLAALVAAFNQANYGFLSKSEFHTVGPLLHPLKDGKTTSLSISKEYTAEQLKDVISNADPFQTEQFIAQIECDYLTRVNNNFELDQVLASVAQLLILFRKNEQNVEEGALKFIVLKDEIRNKVYSPKIPVV